jgi:predicted lipoprotein
MRMKRVLTIVISTAVFFGLWVLLWPYAFTVVSIAEVEQVKQSEAFDPALYVDNIWDSRLYPAINEQAVDITEILKEIQVDSMGMAEKDSLVEVGEKYAQITVGEAHVYKVKGRGKVIGVNTSTSTGTMELLLEGYNGPIIIKVYIGSRIPSDETSIRDSVDFITFGDFKEQTEYGKVAAELNRRVNLLVLEPLDKSALQGKTIAFTGAFTIRTFNLININLSEIKIVPVNLVVE